MISISLEELSIFRVIVSKQIVEPDSNVISGGLKFGWISFFGCVELSTVSAVSTV